MHKVFYKKINYFNCMDRYIFKKTYNNRLKENNYFTDLVSEKANVNKKNILKNYILDPETKIIE